MERLPIINKVILIKCASLLLMGAIVFNLGFAYVFAQEGDAEQAGRNAQMEASNDAEARYISEQNARIYSFSAYDQWIKDNPNATAQDLQNWARDYEKAQADAARASINANASAAASSNSQGASFVQGNNNGVANQTGQAVGSAAGNAAACIGSAEVIAAAKYGLSQAIPAKYLNVNIFNTADATKNGESGIVGWDAVGYCIVNAMITYIADSTIAWINGGFNGNPAFVEDPGQFFKDIADNQAAGFLREIVGNTTGLDICQPFRLEIATGLGAGGAPAMGGPQCTLGSIAANAKSFQAYTSGASPQSGNLSSWNAMTQQPQNNPYGAYLIAQKELQNRIAVKQNTATLDLTTGNGFLSFKKCNPDSKTTDPTTGKTVQVKGACRTTTPGSVIEEQLNSRLKLGTDRLVLADKFDQVVDALVNQLIRTALSQALDGGETTSN